MSHATSLAVQNMPTVLPDDPDWHMGRAGSWQALLLAHMVVHAAYSALWVMQLKQVVPVAQGAPQSGTNVVQTPCTHATAGVPSNRSADPSSVVGEVSAHPQAG